MTTKEAFEYILKHDEEANQYRLSKVLECSHTTIKNYVSGKTKMSDKVYDRFKKIYPTVEVTDVYYIKPKFKLGELK